MIARAAVGALVIGAALVATPASAQPLTVLGVAPEGVVVDAGTAPAVQPGGRMNFRRADGNPAEIAQGFVLDVRDGRALVGLRPGGTVKAGDVAIACASLTGPGSQADLRANFQSLKAQLAATGGGSPDVQVAIGRLESTLDGRENDIRSGACDVSQYDRDIAAQSAQLQQLMAAAPSGGTGGSPLPGAGSPPPPVPPGSPALPVAAPGTVPGSPTLPPPLPGAQGTIGAAPLPGAPDPAQGGATPAPSGGAAGFSDLLQKIFQMVQGMGGGQQASSGGAGQSSQPPFAFAPTDPGSGAAAAPPAGVTPVSSPPSFGSPDTGTGSVSGSPPGAGGTPPAGSQPATPGSGSPTAGGQPPVIGTSPPGPGSPSPPTPSQPPTTGNPPASSGLPWWAVPRKPLPLPGPGAPSGQPVAPGTASPGATSTMTPLPGLRPAPGTTQPPFAPIARVPPGGLNLPATVHGIVRDEGGRPVSDAVIFIGGKRAETSHIVGQEGFFVAAGVPIGRQLLTVTKDGFLPTRQFVDLQSGAVENMSLTLHRAAPSPVLQLQQRPIAPRPGSGRQAP